MKPSPASEGRDDTAPADVEAVRDNRMDPEDAVRFSLKQGLGTRYVRVVRHCPRCHKHRLHSAHHKKVGSRHVVTINCAECGHDWRGRFLRDEWSDEV